MKEALPIAQRARQENEDDQSPAEVLKKALPIAQRARQENEDDQSPAEVLKEALPIAQRARQENEDDQSPAEVFKETIPILQRARQENEDDQRPAEVLKEAPGDPAADPSGSQGRASFFPSSSSAGIPALAASCVVKMPRPTRADTHAALVAAAAFIARRRKKFKGATTMVAEQSPGRGTDVSMHGSVVEQRCLQAGDVPSFDVHFSKDGNLQERPALATASYASGKGNKGPPAKGKDFDQGGTDVPRATISKGGTMRAAAPMSSPCAGHLQSSKKVFKTDGKDLDPRCIEVYHRMQSLEETTRWVLVFDIAFTQESCGDHFSDGTTLQHLLDQLNSGEVQLDAAFLQLSCVETRVGIVSINNRRLLVLKSFAHSLRKNIHVCCRVRTLDADCERLLESCYDGRYHRETFLQQLKLMQTIVFHRDKHYSKKIRVRQSIRVKGKGKSGRKGKAAGRGEAMKRTHGKGYQKGCSGRRRLS